MKMENKVEIGKMLDCRLGDYVLLLCFKRDAI